MEEEARGPPLLHLLGLCNEQESGWLDLGSGAARTVRVVAWGLLARHRATWGIRAGEAFFKSNVPPQLQDECEVFYLVQVVLAPSINNLHTLLAGKVCSSLQGRALCLTQQGRH